MVETAEDTTVKHITIPYSPRRWQAEMHKKLKRFNVLVVHRGAGKSIMCMNELVRKAIQGPGYAEYLYLLPLRNQAHRNVWVPLKRICEPIPNVKYNNTTLEITLPNGAKIMVLGADDPEKLRGLHLHGVILDEFADMHVNTWQAVRPMLTNHRGWVIWIGTPKGHNSFYTKFMQSQEPQRKEWFGEILPWWKTNALEIDEIDAARSEMLPEEFAQELECSFEAALVGSYYGNILAGLREKGRISAEPLYRDDLETYTCFDIGIRDRTSAWWFQLQANIDKDGKRYDDICFIDFEEQSNLSLKDWAEIIKIKARNYGYRYAAHIFPFDIKNREIGSGISRIETLEQVGIYPEVCPAQDVMDGIDLCRRHLPRCKFHSIMCEDGLESLTLYRAKMDKNKQGLGPEHSVFSHAADSFRYGITHIVQVLQHPAMIRVPFLKMRR
jgi:phage terminase large subunit